MSENSTSNTNPYAATQADLSVQRAPDEAELAGRWRRLGASIIDGLLMTVVTMVPTLLFFGGWGKYIEASQSGLSFMFTLGSIVFGFVAYLLINGYFLAKDSQSIGKKILGTKIVRTDGSQADFIRIVTRRLLPLYACGLIPKVGPFLGLVDALFIFRQSKKCLHDDIADTVVIRI